MTALWDRVRSRRIARLRVRAAAVENPDVPMPVAFHGQDVVLDRLRPVIDPRAAVEYQNAPEPAPDHNRVAAADLEQAGPAALHLHVPRRGVETERFQLTRPQIDKLIAKMQTVGDDTGPEVCSVCLEGVSGAASTRSRAVLLPACDHAFHSRCISLWLSRGETGCPICRRDVLGLDTN
jgi:hypothetical protein